ncbi:MAG: hypothetical protein LH702_03475 [Phormidesmis sp. CAN_BIN44]|nr:hypothetical protein [Phormidesmis sp. CAN_BIN44]
MGLCNHARSVMAKSSGDGSVSRLDGIMQSRTIGHGKIIGRRFTETSLHASVNSSSIAFKNQMGKP